MIATHPEVLHELWVAGVNRGDLDGLAGLYEDEAAFVASPGQIISGRDAIRNATASLLSLNPSAQLEPLVVVRTGSLAVLISRWNLTGTGADGKPIEMGGQTADVVRRQDDGRWPFVIDNPWGDQAACT
jgi:uncharacterized protein (TIGR02246 family)